ncbi:MAG: peptidase T [Fibrobacter sp.]|jgi:tripeptide aminopeptidase|nr:peptidase T [Fibrobacter sp.]
MKQKLIDRFCRYVKIDTQSDPESFTFPSSEKQFNLANILAEELKSLGLSDVTVDKFCYVMATVASNSSKESPKIGLIAHLDTSPSLPGKDVKPLVIENYRGGDHIINESLGVVLRESECPELKNCIGHTLITSDGTTLLGADDKAGITAIMTAIEYLVKKPDIIHGEIKIAFTPDEEIGQGADHFDLKKFGADFAYTVDGGFTGELNKETFSADAAIIEVIGRDIHPGTAKGIMVNSIRAMAEIVRRLPLEMAPESTDGYQPFIHPTSAQGDVSSSLIKLILRDFKTEGLKKQKQILEAIIKEVKELFPDTEIRLTITETYRNMADELAKYPHVTERLWKAVKESGVEPFWKPIRGGTDGSRLTAMGLPTPNLFTGSGNHHSRSEWCSVDSMEKLVDCIVNLVKV